MYSPKEWYFDIIKATLLKSHFDMGILMQICCILSEHFFLGAPLGGCFWTSELKKFHLCSGCQIMKLTKTNFVAYFFDF